MKEEFKAFVRKRPYLTKYVNSGEMTWQKFYEQWNLYGEDETVWKKYIPTEESTKKESSSMSFNSVVDMLGKIDKDSLQKGINSVQKVIELLQGLTTKSAVNTASTYSPRQLFKKFED